MLIPRGTLSVLAMSQAGDHAASPALPEHRQHQLHCWTSCSSWAAEHPAKGPQVRVGLSVAHVQPSSTAQLMLRKRLAHSGRTLLDFANKGPAIEQLTEGARFNLTNTDIINT